MVRPARRRSDGPHHVVVQHRAIHRVPQPLVHGDGVAVGFPHEEIHEVPIMHLLADALELSHELLGQALASVRGRDGDGGDVTVPVLAPSLHLAHHVPRDLPRRSLRGAEILGPRREIPEVKVEVEGLREAVRVDVVVHEQVVARERPERRHLSVVTTTDASVGDRPRRAPLSQRPISHPNFPRFVSIPKTERTSHAASLVSLFLLLRRQAGVECSLPKGDTKLVTTTGALEDG